jgi:hypothetical protein
MLAYRKVLRVCVLLMGTSAMSFSNFAQAALPPGSAPHLTSKQHAAVAKVPTRLPPQVIQHPRTTAQGSSSTTPASTKGKETSSNANAASAVVAAKKAAASGAAAVQQKVRGSAIDAAAVASRVDGRNTAELSGITAHIDVISDKIKNSRLDSQVKGVNSATFNSLEKVMPGFSGRAKAGATLRDLGVAGGRNRNPVTDGTSLKNFIGGGAGEYSDGKSSSKTTTYQDGSTTIVKKNATTDVWKDGTIVTSKRDGTTEVNRPNGETDYYGKDGKKTGTTDANGNPKLEPIAPEPARKILDPDHPGLYTDGTPVGGGSGSGGNQGPQKDPVPDDVSQGSSSKPSHITGADLRGLAARRGAAGTPTGDDTASGGGPIDKSKTREGRNGQVGQPVNDLQASEKMVLDSMQIKQALRLRMRNVTPIQN